MAKTTVPIELSSTPSIVDNGNATAITIDSSQNVGIGTSTITNNTLGKTTYFGNSTSLITGDSSSARFWLGNNWYYNSGDKFIGTGYANLYSQQSGEHIFLTSSASGTADASVSFNTVMKIDSSGNVGIGESSPSAKLTVNVGSDGNSVYIDGNGTQLAIGSSSSVNYINSQNGSAALALQTNGSERMRIDSSGNVGIGTSSPASALHVDKSVAAPAVTIHNTGGASSAYAGLEVETSTTGSYIQRWVNSGSERMKITGGGAVFMSSLSYAAASTDLNYNTGTGEIFVVTSSRRYKSNITDLDIDTSKILSLRPVSYTDNNSGTNAVGLIAEEVHEEIPQLVNYKEIEGYDEIQPDSVKYSTLSVYLLKAIKELKSELDDAKARIQTLEGN